MKKSALTLAAVWLAVMMLLAACGNSKKENASSPPAETKQQEQPSKEEAQKAPFAFKDTKGEQTLPHSPERIATTVTYLTDHMIALGLTPKATVKSQNEDFPVYLQPYLKNVDIIGEQGRVNVEKLLSLAPDLIITDTNSTELYDSYAKIAPTAILENGYVAPDWQAAFRATAGVFNLNDKAEQVIGDYEKHKKEAIGKVRGKVEGKTLMVLRIRNDIRYYGDMDYKWLYDDFGFVRPQVYPVTSAENRYEVLSKEKLPEIDPDYILLINDNEELYNSLKDLALWQNMKAVKNERVFPIASDSWFGGYGPNAATSMLDDLVRLFGN